MFGRLVGAALVSAALVVSASVAVRADALPSEGTLPGGGTYIVRPLGGAPVAAIALWYRASSSGFESAPSPGLGQLAATAVAASQPITGTALGTFVNRLGGRMTISAYPESVAVSILVPADRAALAVRALTRSFFSPVLTDAGLLAARHAVGEEAAIRALSSDAAISDTLYASLFASGPAQAPPLPAPAALAAISIDTVRAYAERAFRPGNAVLVFAGSVTPDLATAALAGSEGALPGSEAPLADVPAVPAPITKVGPDAGFGFAWIGPPIADEPAATALDFIADYLFGDDGPIETATRSSGADVEGTFVTYHNPGVFIVTASGGNVAAARGAVLDGLTAMRTPLAADAFERARRRFVYRLLSHAQTPDAVADNYGWYSVEGAPAYTPGDNGAAGRYLREAAALTPAFVAATATKYLALPGASVTVSLPPDAGRQGEAHPSPAASPAGSSPKARPS